MSSERGLWGTVSHHLGRYGRLVRVENGVGPGTADVAFCLRRNPTRRATSGWLELKHEGGWPRDPARSLIVESLTKEQADWHRDWVLAGGRAHCLLQVGSTYLLLPSQPTMMRELFERRYTEADLRRGALASADGTFPARRMILCLTDD